MRAGFAGGQASGNSSRLLSTFFVWPPHLGIVPAIVSPAAEGTVVPHRTFARLAVHVRAISVGIMGDEEGTTRVVSYEPARCFFLGQGKIELAACGPARGQESPAVDP